jgi:hypothetical protein
MVSIMVNKHTYKPSLHDIIEKYYEMFRDIGLMSKTQKT